MTIHLPHLRRRSFLDFNRASSVCRFPCRALTLCPQLCMGIQPGARFPAWSAHALPATLYGHFTQAINRNRPIAPHDVASVICQVLCHGGDAVAQTGGGVGAAEVGRCRLPVSKPVSKEPAVPALELIISYTAFKCCFQFQLAPLNPGSTTPSRRIPTPATSTSSAAPPRHGLTLVHFSAPRKRFLWDGGCM
jgi:hypothetical protein